MVFFYIDFIYRTALLNAFEKLQSEHDKFYCFYRNKDEMNDPFPQIIKILLSRNDIDVNRQDNLKI